MFFLDRPLVVILIRGFDLFCLCTILLTWSIFFAFKAGKVFLIFKTSDVLIDVLDACAYDLLVSELADLSELLAEDFLGWKYLEMTLISFLDLAGSGGRGGALLMVTGVDLGMSFLELPLGGGIQGVNFEAILALRVFDFWSVSNASYLDA